MCSSPVKIVMPYIGRSLSVNYYKIVGRGGVATRKTKPEVERWMEDLSDEISSLSLNLEPPVVVRVLGKFVDERCPDIDNLAKVILDAVKVGLGIDDKFLKFESKGYDTGYETPVLEITLESSQGGS